MLPRHLNNLLAGEWHQKTNNEANPWRIEKADVLIFCFETSANNSCPEVTSAFCCTMCGVCCAWAYVKRRKIDRRTSSTPYIRVNHKCPPAIHASRWCHSFNSGKNLVSLKPHPCSLSLQYPPLGRLGESSVWSMLKWEDKYFDNTTSWCALTCTDKEPVTIAFVIH